MRVVFSNDDFGLNNGFDNAISDGFSQGASTSASILTNGTVFKDAIKLLKTKLKKIGIGVHLNLTDGPSSTKKLTDENGNFKNSFLSLLIKVTAKKSYLTYIEEEFEKQIIKMVNENISIDHLDSDKHVHMIPAIFEIVCKLAKKYGIEYVRVTRENFYLLDPKIENFSRTFLINIPKAVILNYFAKINLKILKKYRLKTTDSFYGLLHSNEMTENKIISALKDAKKKNYQLIEILSHPAYINEKIETKSISPLMLKYSKLNVREQEAKAINNKAVLDFLHQQNIKKTRFKDL